MFDKQTNHRLSEKENENFMVLFFRTNFFTLFCIPFQKKKEKKMFRFNKYTNEGRKITRICVLALKGNQIAIGNKTEIFTSKKHEHTFRVEIFNYLGP